MDKPRRYDAIIFWDEKESEGVFKRVIGLPGETVTIKDGKIYIDNKPHQNIFGIGLINGKGFFSAAPIKVPKNSYFVIGDNRDDTFFGVIGEDEIVGKAIF
jgi:signal peptidase I